MFLDLFPFGKKQNRLGIKNKTTTKILIFNEYTINRSLIQKGTKSTEIKIITIYKKN